MTRRRRSKKLHRCYQQLTQSFLKPSDPMLAKVDAGQDPVEVCITDVFRRGYFTSDSNGNFAVSSANMAVGKLVTNTFHLLHSSWFTFRDIPIGTGFNSNANTGALAMLEPNGAALYYTRALFDQSVDASYFLNTSEYLRSLRDQGPSTSSIYITPTLATTLTAYQGVNLLYKNGTPYGVRVLTTAEKTFTSTAQDNLPRGASNFPASSITLFNNYGGGNLGMDIYMARSVDIPITDMGDGVSKVPRKWSQSIYSDILCRDIPVIRPSDAAQLVDTHSDALFRQSTGCVACHASIDRMSGLIKSYAFIERNKQGFWTPWVDTSLWNKGPGADYSWSSNYRSTYTYQVNTFSNYRKEDHTGRLNYRGFDGRLVDVKVCNHEHLRWSLGPGNRRSSD